MSLLSNNMAFFIAILAAFFSFAPQNGTRCLYDYVFYLSKGISFNRKHLRARLLQSGHITDDMKFELSDIKKMLDNKFDSIDFKQAKEDVAPFIRDARVLDIWSADFFKQITNGLTEWK